MSSNSFNMYSAFLYPFSKYLLIFNTVNCYEIICDFDLVSLLGCELRFAVVGPVFDHAEVSKDCVEHLHGGQLHVMRQVATCLIHPANCLDQGPGVGLRIRDQQGVGKVVCHGRSNNA